MEPIKVKASRKKTGFPRIYLAGPDVFRPDALAVFARLVAGCKNAGLHALVPLDNEPVGQGLSTSRPDMAQAIFEQNVTLLRSADGVIANLQCFRGLEPDSGTVFEVGFAIALGLPIYGYGVPVETYGERVCAALGWRRDATGAARTQPDDTLVEEFDQRLNLMLARSVTLVATVESAIEQMANLFRSCANQQIARPAASRTKAAKAQGVQ